MSSSLLVLFYLIKQETALLLSDSHKTNTCLGIGHAPPLPAQSRTDFNN